MTTPVPAAPVMTVRGLVSGYDGSRVVDEVDLTVAAGETVALLGRNGVGKTTLVETVMGLVRPVAGQVLVGADQVDVAGRKPHVVARAGVAIVPQGRRVFAPLTVEENLRVAARKRKGRTGQTWTVDGVYALMPRLAERRTNLGSQLSGGEQQMLAIGRALLGSPDLLLLDEPSDGLAPAVVETVGEVLRDLAGSGMALLVVEQDLRLAFSVADRVVVMNKGRIVHESTTAEFRSDGARARSLLGIG
ncbi:ABC transporter ATP-binding protein [uncultured Nocardioides sp.]|uniref:ABC transporter ATP-binding protein n=1 Tax=uncultured Nocardioides sp. TaxID=198441 RepID=UPI002607ECD5|nr:ABC transporter ATP-binding protein [uncultured Nocardioides sp.]